MLQELVHGVLTSGRAACSAGGCRRVSWTAATARQQLLTSHPHNKLHYNPIHPHPPVQDEEGDVLVVPQDLACQRQRPRCPHRLRLLRQPGEQATQTRAALQGLHSTSQCSLCPPRQSIARGQPASQPATALPTEAHLHSYSRTQSSPPTCEHVILMFSFSSHSFRKSIITCRQYSSTGRQYSGTAVVQGRGMGRVQKRQTRKPRTKPARPTPRTWGR